MPKSESDLISYSSGSPRVVPRPAAPAIPGELVTTQILKPYPGLAELEVVEVGLPNLLSQTTCGHSDAPSGLKSFELWQEEGG